jgi:hypothetical protein
MKKLVGLLAVLCLLSAGAYLLFKKGQSTEKGIVTADRGFTVKSMDEVDKIVIKHVKLQPLVFTKKGKNWILNGEFDVDPAVFVNIERVLTNMKLSYIPPAAATPVILKSIKENGIQVDLYDGDDQPFKIFHIGSDVQKGEGTYMVMAGSNQPYVMQLPGLEGGLRSRFEQPAKNYRDKIIYKITPEDIVSIKVEYPKDNFSSFEIINGSTPQVKPLISLPDQPQGAPNQRLLMGYISQFANMGAEGLITEMPERDSIINLKPNATLTLVTKNGDKLYHKYYSYDHIVLGEDNPITQAEVFASNRFFIYDTKDDMYTGQMKVIGGIFYNYKDFFRKDPAIKN